MGRVGRTLLSAAFDSAFRGRLSGNKKTQKQTPTTKSKIKIKSGGQECPPHMTTYFFCLAMIRSLILS